MARLLLPPTMSFLLAVALLAPPLAQAQNWVLQFSDEFNGTSLDATKWNALEGVFTQYGGSDAYFAAANVILENGLLRLRSTNVPTGGKQWTTAAINSFGKYNIPAGDFKIEYRAKISTQNGFWPAFWGNEVTGSQFGTFHELDVMESYAIFDNFIFQTLHQWSWNGTNWVDSVIRECRPFNAAIDYGAGFHTYAMEAHNGQYTWHLDGVNTCTVTYPRPAFPHDIRIQNTIGGNGGAPNQFNTWPDYMDVDYVRVYRNAGSDTAPPTAPTNLRVQ